MSTLTYALTTSITLQTLYASTICDFTGTDVESGLDTVSLHFRTFSVSSPQYFVLWHVVLTRLVSLFLLLPILAAITMAPRTMKLDED